MDKIIGKVPEKDILKFNEIRKYLKYFHLKEIASSADREKFITGIPYESTWKWPESPMTPRWRLIWSRLMKKYAHLLTETKIMREIKQESNNIFQVIASLPKDYQRLLGRIRIKKFFDMRNVSEEMLIGASDGSAKYETGTGSWCITINKQMFAWSQIPIDGKQPDSHRAECLALISLLTFLDILSTRMSIHTRSIIIIDCESIIDIF
jgi:hypothetical protein